MSSVTPKPIREIAVHVPQDILQAVQEQTQSRITQTITNGLRKLVVSGAYRTLGTLQDNLSVGP